jgi:hypothetical protein
MKFVNKFRNRLSILVAVAFISSMATFCATQKVDKHDSTLAVQSIWDWEHYRHGKLIDKWRDKNIIPNESLDDILDVYFSDGTQKTTHYLLIYESDTSPAAGMTYAVPVFTESTAYTESTRPAWTEAGVSSQSITNSASKASFTMNASKTIYGAGMVCGGTDADTKGDTAGGGVLNHVAAFTSGSKAVENADVLKVTVTISASDV